MNLTDQSIWLFILLLVPIGLFFYAIFYTSKERKGLDIFIKPVTLILFTIVLFFTYRIGLVEEGSYTSNHSINFVAITAAIKVYTGEYRGEIVELATNNNTYAALLYTASIFGFLFVFYVLFGVVIRLMTNNMRLRYYKGCKNIYLFGNDDKINTFMKSMEPDIIDKINSDEERVYFKRFFLFIEWIKFFFPWETKVIIVMPKDAEGKLVITPTFIKPAIIYADVTNSILQSIVLTSNTHEQTIISLYEEDDLNTKLIGSLNNLLSDGYVHYSNQQNNSKNEIDYSQNWKNYHSYSYLINHKHDPITEQRIHEWWCAYTKKDTSDYQNQSEDDIHSEFRKAVHTLQNLSKDLKKDIARYEKTQPRIKAHIHFMDLDSLNMLETRMNLKNRVDFYSQNSMVAYQYAFDHPVMRYQTEGKKSIHYVLVGFGLTNRNILRYLMVNNVISDMECTYTAISNDDKNTLDHFEQKLNIKEFYKKLNDDPGKSHSKLTYLPEINITDTLGIYDFKAEMDVTKKEFINFLDKLDLHKKDQIVFVVALGKDIMNIDLGHKLYEYTKQNDLLEKTEIDLRIVDDELDITPLFGNKKDTVKSFGKYKDVYVYENIIAKEYQILARGVHKGLGFYESPFETESHMSRLSSLYAALSLRNKLLYFNMDLALKTDQKNWQANAVSSFDYYKNYFELDLDGDQLKKRINTLRTDLVMQNEPTKLKKYYPIPRGPKKPVPKRDIIAIQEHDRWNAFKILDGTIPMAIETLHQNMEDSDYEGNPGKNESDNTHVCLTTRDGLISLAKYIYDKNQTLLQAGKIKKEYSIDKIFLDYAAMDNLPIVLEDSGYYICKIEKED